jgi:hypothetical protein
MSNDDTDHKYSTGPQSTDETRQQWSTDERRVLFSWTCKPFVGVKHRHDTVECRLAVEFTPGVGLDVLLEARSDDTGKVPDDWAVMVSVEGRDGRATYRRKPEARWVE